MIIRLTPSTRHTLATTSGCWIRNTYRSGSHGMTRTGSRRKTLVRARTQSTFARAPTSILSYGIDRWALSRAALLVFAASGLVRALGAVSPKLTATLASPANIQAEIIARSQWSRRDTDKEPSADAE